MNEAFREWLRRNRTKEQMELAQQYHNYNHNMIDDFIFCYEERVMEWVAEQCKAVLEEMAKHD